MIGNGILEQFNLYRYQSLDRMREIGELEWKEAVDVRRHPISVYHKKTCS
jgi:hypothetical protein